MRALSVFALVLILVLPFWVGYLGLSWQKKAVRRSVKAALAQQLDEEELQLWRLSPAQARALEWEDNKEFEHQGQRYDVVRMAFQDGQVLIWCWWDHEESAIERRLEQLVRRALGGDSDPHSPAASWGDCLKRVFTTTNWALTAPPAPLRITWASATALQPCAPALAPPVPPPNA